MNTWYTFHRTSNNNLFLTCSFLSLITIQFSKIVNEFPYIYTLQLPSVHQLYVSRNSTFAMKYDRVEDVYAFMGKLKIGKIYRIQRLRAKPSKVYLLRNSPVIFIS